MISFQLKQKKTAREEKPFGRVSGSDDEKAAEDKVIKSNVLSKVGTNNINGTKNIQALFQEAAEADEEQEKAILRGVRRGSSSQQISFSTTRSLLRPQSSSIKDSEDLSTKIIDPPNQNSSNDECYDLNDPYDDDDVVGQRYKSNKKRCVSQEDVKKTNLKNRPEVGLVNLGRFAEPQSSSHKSSSQNRLLQKESKQSETSAAAGKSMYISSLINRSTRREMEREIIKERQLKKQSEARKLEGKEEEEIFVTGAYKRRLLERQKYEEEIVRKDLVDVLNDAKKKKDLTPFHHYLLTKGLSSRSRANEVPTPELSPKGAEDKKQKK